MAFTDPLAAAPDQCAVRLERYWAAVFLQLLPGGSVAAVDLFRRGHFETVVDDPGEVAGPGPVDEAGCVAGRQWSGMKRRRVSR